MRVKWGKRGSREAIAEVRGWGSVGGEGVT